MWARLIVLAVGAAALVAPPASSRSAALSVARASATAEVPVKTFDGGDSGTATLTLKTTKGQKDMYVVHRKYVNERRNARAGTASTKTRGEVRGGGRKPFNKRARAARARGRSGRPSRSGAA